MAISQGRLVVLRHTGVDDPEAVIDELLDEIERLQKLIIAILTNDPEDAAADGVLLIDVWRKEVERLLPTKRKKVPEPNRSVPRADQVVMSAGGADFFADPPLVPLLSALNEAGIETYSHCAGHEAGAPAWVVINLTNLWVEIRPKALDDSRPAQIILTWVPSWAAPQRTGEQHDE